MRRVLALLLAMVAAATFLAAPVAASHVPQHNANSVDDFYWSDNFGGWVDGGCTGTTGWWVAFYDGTNLSGNHVKICTWTADFCTVPDTHEKNLTCGFQLYPFPHKLNDYPSSISWYVEQGGCVSVYADTQYSGNHVRLHGGNVILDLDTTAVGEDNASSVKRVGDDKC